MFFSKQLLTTAAGILCLAAPAMAAPSPSPKLPDVSFPSQGAIGNWDPSSVRRLQTLRTELASTASWYGVRDGFHGRQTANGEIFNAFGMTAAHRSLPFGTRVRVTNLNNNRSVVVRITDRGPFVGGRIIDLSEGAAARIGMLSTGTAPVRLQILN